MRTLTFTDEEWEYVEAFADAPREFWPEMARMVRDQLHANLPPVTGHDTVWLMAHEG